jgi:hypothetical protein
MRLQFTKIKRRDFRLLAAICLCVVAFLASDDSGNGCKLTDEGTVMFINSNEKDSIQVSIAKGPSVSVSPLYGTREVKLVTGIYRYVAVVNDGDKKRMWQGGFTIYAMDVTEVELR